MQMKTHGSYLLMGLRSGDVHFMRRQWVYREQAAKSDMAGRRDRGHMGTAATGGQRGGWRERQPITCARIFAPTAGQV